MGVDVAVLIRRSICSGVDGGTPGTWRPGELRVGSCTFKSHLLAMRWDSFVSPSYHTASGMCSWDFIACVSRQQTMRWEEWLEWSMVCVLLDQCSHVYAEFVCGRTCANGFRQVVSRCLEPISFVQTHFHFGFSQRRLLVVSLTVAADREQPHDIAFEQLLKLPIRIPHYTAARPSRGLQEVHVGKAMVVESSMQLAVLKEFLQRRLFCYDSPVLARRRPRLLF